ncbi:MAG: hypothetical protein DRP66_02240 [Planctomycetota bacterium]|nr:MAG: hypothetical protein DRP66_02240 [Planctomycetota bacterium]
MTPRKKKKKKQSWFGFGSPPKRRKKKHLTKAARARSAASVRKVAGVIAAVVALGCTAIAFGYMDRYVHTLSPATEPLGQLELVAPPEWINPELQATIAAAAGGYYFPLEEGIAEIIAARLQGLSWIYNIRVRVTSKTVHIYAGYRKPTAMIMSGSKKYYLALIAPDDLSYEQGKPKVMLLDYIKLDTLPVVEIKGLSLRRLPVAGDIRQGADITSTVELLTVLGRMDEISCAGAPLLDQLAGIDISNFAGRKNKNSSHIVLNAKDGTPIYWGAAYGDSALYLEATEQEKLATLYTFYKEHGNTIQCVKNAICNSIDLRYAQTRIPRPEESLANGPGD